MQQYIITRLVVTMPPFVMAGPLVWDNQSDTANTSQWYITTLERSRELDLALKTLTRQSILALKYWSMKESWLNSWKIGSKTRQVWTVQMNGRQHSKRSHCFGAKFSSFQGKRIYETNTSIDNQRLWCAMCPVSLLAFADGCSSVTIMPSVHYDNLVTKSHSDTDDDASSMMWATHQI